METFTYRICSRVRTLAQNGVYKTLQTCYRVPIWSR